MCHPQQPSAWFKQLNATLAVLNSPAVSTAASCPLRHDLMTVKPLQCPQLKSTTAESAGHLDFVKGSRGQMRKGGAEHRYR